MQSFVAAIRRPPVAHEHAGVVGPQHRGGIVEPAAGADRVDRRVRSDERPEPVADGADAPAGLVRRDHGRAPDLLAQFRVGRRGGAGGPMQHVGETADVTSRPNVVRSGCATFASGTPISVCNSTTSATTPGPSCTPAAPARRRSAARGGPAPAADTARSGQPRCRSAARPGAPRAVLPGLRRRAGHFDRVAAPTAVSGARSLASGGRSLVAGGCSCAAAGPSPAAGSPRPAPTDRTVLKATACTRTPTMRGAMPSRTTALDPQCVPTPETPFFGLGSPDELGLEVSQRFRLTSSVPAVIVPVTSTGVNRYTRTASRHARATSPARSASRTSSSLNASSRDRCGVQPPSSSTISTVTSAANAPP